MCVCVYIYIYKVNKYIYIYSVSQKWVHPSHFCRCLSKSLHGTTLTKWHFDKIKSSLCAAYITELIYFPLKIIQNIAIKTKPQPTKVSTPLRENCQYKHAPCQQSIFFVATIIIQNCLYSPRHGVYQCFTGSHWDSLPLLHDDAAELADIWVFAHLHLPLEDTPKMFYWVQVCRHAWLVHHLYSQPLQ